MIYIRVEMWPWGDRNRARLLGEATIANVGGDAARGGYDVQLSRTSPSGNPSRAGFDGGADASPGHRMRSTWRAARVLNYPRQSLVMWELIRRALNAACDAPPLRGGKRRG